MSTPTKIQFVAYIAEINTDPYPPPIMKYNDNYIDIPPQKLSLTLTTAEKPAAFDTSADMRQAILDLSYPPKSALPRRIKVTIEPYSQTEQNQDTPTLLAEVERLRELLEKVETYAFWGQREGERDAYETALMNIREQTAKAKMSD